jgi:hypothetical protein
LMNGSLMVLPVGVSVIACPSSSKPSVPTSENSEALMRLFGQEGGNGQLDRADGRPCRRGRPYAKRQVTRADTGRLKTRSVAAFEKRSLIRMLSRPSCHRRPSP